MTPAEAPSRLQAHLEILRLDHWVKNVFVLPGVVVALSLDRGRIEWALAGRLALGLLAAGLVASANYVINAVLDARTDGFHPEKRLRPAVTGRIGTGWAYAQWLALWWAGLGTGWLISPAFGATMLLFGFMGCVYNVPPVRAKDIPVLDVLAEAVNNPIRMLAGWYLTLTAAVPSTSLLIAYWMIGCYFMAIKRLSEVRGFGGAGAMASYRKSFAWYDERRLSVSIMFYAAHSMLFFGAFLMRYRMELIVSFPLLAWVMASYYSLAFRGGGAAEHPEKLHRERSLMIAVTLCAASMGALLFVDLPWLHHLFTPSAAR
jgi:decaprenyl-phosphate phosphoribosyltransferase